MLPRLLNQGSSSESTSGKASSWPTTSHAALNGNRPTMKNVCHVHRITVEAIQNGWEHENFATPCYEYSDLEGAKVCLPRDFHVGDLIVSLQQLRLML
jgi:hypothetical protein